jgi:hypothetical protein
MIALSIWVMVRPGLCASRKAWSAGQHAELLPSISREIRMPGIRFSDSAIYLLFL